MRHALALSILLSAFWLVNSGHYTPLLLTFMLASVASIVALSHYMDMVDGEAQPLTITFTLPIYLLWLAKEVVLANVAVAKCVWLGEKGYQSPDYRRHRQPEIRSGYRYLRKFDHSDARHRSVSIWKTTRSWFMP